MGFLSNGTTESTTHKHGDMRDYRSPSLLQPHRLREAILDAHEGRIPPIMGYFHMLANPQMCKVVSQLGFDIVLIDQEHSAMNIETMVNMVNDIQHISEGRSIAMVRVSGHDHDNIGYVLDAGASIMIPQIETVSQARHVLASCKLGVKNGGTRSVPPARYIPGFSDTLHDPSITLWESFNRSAAIIIQLESEQGVRNLDAILTECGHQIDACFIGTLDVRASMGLGGPWGDEPEFVETVQLFGDTLIKHNKPRAGGVAGSLEMKKQLGSNNSVVFTTLDVHRLVESAVSDLTEGRDLFPAKDFRTLTKDVKKEKIKRVANGEQGALLEAVVDADGAEIWKR